MSTIDLERLIVKKTYFIPLSVSEASAQILNKLNASSPSVAGRNEWYVEGIQNYRRFSLDFLYNALINHILKKGLKPTEISTEAEKFISEFARNLPKSLIDAVKNMRTNTPAELQTTFRTVENGCECKVKVFPILYARLSQKLGKVYPDDFGIQDAYLTCEGFLESTFEGGLSATLISEEKKEVPKPTTQLLVNDQSLHQIFDKIKEMLKQATGEVLLCGWIGTLLLPTLKEMKQKGVSIRVITHKEGELKGQSGRQDVQRAYKELISMISKDNISIRPECHCRVVVVDNKALIGSMDINAISLTGSHRELAIYTEDPEIVRNLRKYFNQIFSPLKK